jgi:hypothetical protein
LFGSKLRNRATDAEIWPGSATTILFHDYRDIALDFDRSRLAVTPDGLEAFDVADAALGQDFYHQLLDTLQLFGVCVRGKRG